MFTYSYDLAGRLATIEYPEETDIVAKFDDGATPTPNPGWNANGQLTHLRYLKGGAHLHSFEYDYDDAGNRKTFIDTPQNTANAIRWEYSYNWLNQLAEVKRGDGGATPVTVSLYAYDESDNRIELQLPVLDEVHTYTYNAADEIVDRSVAVGAGLPVVMETFSHDLDGNMTGRVLDPNGTPQSTTYTWSTFDRLTRIETPGAVVSSSYDSGGIRKKKTGGDGVALKSFYSTLPVVSESVDSGDISYILGYQLMGFEKSGDFYYFIADGLTSVRTLTDESGAVVASYLHDEFGRRQSFSETGGHSSKTYVGAFSVHDDSQETNLLYMRQRWYDPSLGRFLSKDPIGPSGGLNLFSYTQGDPINKVDPSGLNGGLGGPGVDANDPSVQAAWQAYGKPIPPGPPVETTPAGYVAATIAGGTMIAMIGPSVVSSFLANPGAWMALLEGMALGLAGYEGPSAIPAANCRTWMEAGISRGDAIRIQNAATSKNMRVIVVGSRARGTAGPLSDWDYIVGGPTCPNSRQRSRVRNSLPRGISGGEMNTLDQYTGMDFMQDVNPDAHLHPFNPLNPSMPHVIFEPGGKI